MGWGTLGAVRAGGCSGVATPRVMAEQLQQRESGAGNGQAVASAVPSALALGDSGLLLSTRAVSLQPPVLPFPPLGLQKEHLLCTG